MTAPRPFALLSTCDQWVRCAFDGTTLDRAEGTVELAWITPAGPDNGRDAPRLGAGLAFDSACRLYHSVPDHNQVERVRWGARAVIPTRREPAVPVSLFGEATRPSFGTFVTTSADATIGGPRGLAVDGRDRLWIAATDADRIFVFDLWDSRLLRTIRLPGERPTALAAQGEEVYAILATSGQVVALSLNGGATPLNLPPSADPPSRLAVSARGRIAVLAAAGRPDASVAFLDGATDPVPVPRATDIAWESDVSLVVARQPEADFLRFNVELRGASAIGPLRARGYDGLGIAASPERKERAGGHECRCGGGCGADAAPRWIVYWTDRGPRTAVPARLRYERRGRVVTFQLDSGTYQSEWGRIFLDACLTEGTDVRIRCIARDDEDEEPELARTPPVRVSLSGILHAKLSPPMPPVRLIGTGESPARPLHRRESGRELPWTQPFAGDPFRTYEAPTDATGRYLWVILELTGNTQVTPKVRCLRAEHTRHDARQRLPRAYSIEPEPADFLDRYLALPDGFLAEADGRAQARHALLHPWAVPDQLLSWLSSFIGLVLDDRWARAPRPGGRTADARREIIAAAAWLWRFRGTVPGLRRFLELFVGLPIVIIEQFQLRGLRGAGAGSAALADSVLGGGFRIGAPIGGVMTHVIQGNEADAFTSNAHRFTVLIPAALDAEQLDVVRHILEVHRPAHTLVEVCTVEAGMRVGRGLHLALSTIVGPTAGFGTAQLGRSALGRGAILGRPVDGSAAGSYRVGTGGRVR